MQDKYFVNAFGEINKQSEQEKGLFGSLMSLSMFHARDKLNIPSFSFCY